MNKMYTIPPDAMITTTISGSFLRRLQMLALFLLEDKSQEELDLLKVHLQDQTTPEDSWMYQFETVAAIVKDLEKVAQDTGLVKEDIIPEDN